MMGIWYTPFEGLNPILFVLKQEKNWSNIFRGNNNIYTFQGFGPGTIWKEIWYTQHRRDSR